jgi:hypothetical protein
MANSKMTDLALPVFVTAGVVMPWALGAARASDVLKIFWGLAIVATAAWMFWGDVHLYVPKAYGTPIAISCFVVSLICAGSQVRSALKSAT